MPLRHIWHLVASGDLNIDLSEKMTEYFRKHSLGAIERFFSNTFYPSYFLVNPRRAGGAFRRPPPTLRFFANSEKRRRAAPLFSDTFLYVPSAPSLEIPALGHLRSGHQVISSDPISVKFLQLHGGYSV